jgi:uncharacterized protein (DUF1330 family)
MTGILKITAAIVGGLLIGGGSVQLLHAQSKPPAYVVAEVAVKDKAGFEENFLKPTMKDIADHGGKYLAEGYNKTVSLSGAEPQNRVVILQFANMDAVKEWRDQGAMDMENTVGNKYASFRIYAVEGVAP